MSQAAFATFIEDNVLDLIDRPSAEDASTIFEVARTLNTEIASVSKMVELARGITINESNKAKSSFTPSTGEMHIEYLTEHKDGAGQKLKVPGMFLIAIPVYENDNPYRIAVRLRYRIREGQVQWAVSLYQPDKCLDDAFDGMAQSVAEMTGLPVYFGTPE